MKFLIYFLLFLGILQLSFSVSLSRVKTKQVDYKAAFLTANIEGSTYTVDELEKALSNANKDIKSINDYDVLFIALQETNTDMKKVKLTLENFACSLQHKIGFTKFPSAYALVSIVCYKSEKFNDVAEKNPNGWGLRLKGGIGKCIKPKTGEEIVYCFLNLHLDTSPMDGASRLLSTIKKISKKDTVSPVQKVVVYSVGDWNLRVFPLYPAVHNENSLKTLLSSSMDLLKEGNKKTENLFIEKFEELSGKLTDAKKFSISFPPANLDSLPLTYKYSGNELDYKNMLKTKPLGDKDDTQLNNMGWLDRLGCLWSPEAGKCRIQGLQYAARPELKKGDHMPLVGSFEFSQG